MTEQTHGDPVGREQRLAELRARVRALEDECLVLRAGLRDADGWHGIAGAAYRLQLARLRAGVERVLSWLDAARAEL